MFPTTGLDYNLSSAVVYIQVWKLLFLVSEQWWNKELFLKSLFVNHLKHFTYGEFNELECVRLCLCDSRGRGGVLIYLCFETKSGSLKPCCRGPPFFSPSSPSITTFPEREGCVC